MVSGESQPKLACVHSGGLWRPTKALRAGPLRLVVTQHALDHPLACLGVAGRRSHSVRHDWARRPWRGIAGAAIINMRHTAVQKYSRVLPLNTSWVSLREP